MEEVYLRYSNNFYRKTLFPALQIHQPKALGVSAFPGREKEAGY